MVSLLCLFGLMLASLALTTVMLRLLARWLKSPHATWGRAAGAVGLLALAGIALKVVHLRLQALLPPTTDITLTAGLLLLVLEVAASWTILSRVFVLPIGRTIAMWLSMMAVAGVQVLLMLWLVRPYVLEAVLVPTNGMAPTVLGSHRDTTCSKCGGPAIVSTYPGRHGTDVRPEGICTKCRSAGDYPGVRGEDRAGDRLVISKLQKPQRWDVVAFHPGRAPAEKYLQRLVGMPGETIFIEDGAVWIDGRKLDLPVWLAGQMYVIPRFSDSEAPTRDRPVKLEQDECYLLGDFSRISLDSRFDGPVKWPSIIGVADLVYWPPSRAGFLR